MARFVFASDSFKGTLSSARTAELLAAAAARHFPGCAWAAIDMADGGEGTVAAVLSSVAGELVGVGATGPYGDEVEASFGVLEDGSAIIETAAASGITLSDRRDPLRASSRGTGELVARALDAGCRVVRIGLGGSATNDGGMGMLAALGVVFRDDKGDALAGTGADLARVATVDVSGLRPEVGETRFVMLSDVDNPLLGPDGATMTFGRQKGADGVGLARLEAGMENYAARVAEALGRDFSREPGAGAAGGIGFACKAFLGAEAVSGAEAVLDLAGFDGLVAGCDLVVTGEGHADAQTGHGKVMSVVARRARKLGVPVVAVVGGMDAGFDAERLGIDAVVPCVPDVMDIGRVVADAERHYGLAADRLFSLLRLGGSFRA